MDFFNLSSYIIPRHHIPVLSEEMKDRLYVHFITAESEQRFARHISPGFRQGEEGQD